MSGMVASATDEIESLILLAMDATARHDREYGRVRESDGRIKALRDQGELTGTRDMRPGSAYTFDISDEDRIFTGDPSQLLAHPADILGAESEVTLLDGNKLKWVGFRRIQKPQVRVSVLGVPSVWYEMHSRCVYLNGENHYLKRLVPFSNKGAPLPAKVQGHWVCKPEKEGLSAVISASLIEDAHRADSMLARVRDGVEIKFPVPLDDYLAVFADRDGPMVRGRRKAIIHWVAEHVRRPPKRKPHAVKAHTRGVRDIVLDGLTVNITPNARYRK